MSCSSKTVKAMATAAATASTIRAVTLGPLSSSNEMEGSMDGWGVVGLAAAALGAPATLAGAGLAVVGVATASVGATRGLLGLRSASSSKEGVVAAADFADAVGFGADAGAVLGVDGASTLGSALASGVSAEFSFLGSFMIFCRVRGLGPLSR